MHMHVLQVNMNVNTPQTQDVTEHMHVRQVNMNVNTRLTQDVTEHLHVRQVNMNVNTLQPKTFRSICMCGKLT